MVATWLLLYILCAICQFMNAYIFTIIWKRYTKALEKLIAILNPRI